MLDARGDVLYVGKARALKNRVTNYTQVARLPQRLQRMVSQTRAMEIVTTVSEAEALLLEAQLIKRYRPPYNVLLRDDRSEEHTSELQSLMRISYAVFCLKNKTPKTQRT